MKRTQSSLFFVVILLPTLFFTNISYASTGIAVIYSSEGEAHLVNPSKNVTAPVIVGQELFEGDRIDVARGGRVGLEFHDGSFVRLGSLTSLVIRGSNDAPVLNVPVGDVHVLSRDPLHHPTIETPTVTAAVRGTEVGIHVTANESIVAVLEGRVEAYNKFGNTMLSAGEAARAKLGQAPFKDITISLPDTVQWTVFMPFIGSSAEFTGVKDFESKLAFAKTASVKEIAANMKSLPDDLKLLNARILLDRGAIDEGVSILNGLLNSTGEIKDKAKATLSLLALGRGDLKKARAQYEEIDSQNRHLPSVIAASSLLCQAEKNLDCALSEISKDSSLADYSAARKAELYLAQGEISKAQDAIKNAASNSYSETIKGFIDLAAMDRDQAAVAFEKASELASGSALPKLGMALVAINKNNLQRGRELLLQAIQLEPTNSSLRSYLGKLFSESGDEKLAFREYSEAIRLDPNDPTPWLYKSYSNISQNKPVAALSDIRESIKRNENRAVFRSGLLLDQDSAVRSANLSKVYRDLGFFELGRIEAVDALASNYRNYSAHRLLAESQDTLFLLDAASSERRIADILAPLSLNLFDSIGASTSFEDYSGLFDRDETKRSIGTDFNSHRDFYNPSALIAGKNDKFGYATSIEGGIANGSAAGNSNQDYRFSQGLFYQPLWNARFGLRSFLQYTRDFDNQSLEEQQHFKRFNINLSGNYDIDSSTSVLLASSVQRSIERANSFDNKDTILSTAIFKDSMDTATDDILFNRQRRGFVTSTQNEAQLIHENDLISSVFGLQARTENPHNTETSLILDDSRKELSGSNLSIGSSSANDLRSYSSYLYNTVHLQPFQLIGGMEYEHVERELSQIAPFLNGTDSRERLSPKFGLIYHPNSALTLRSSYLEGISKSSIFDQDSLEPTQVAGINQRFNDLPGTKYRSIGSGANLNLSDSTFTGAEWIRRNLAEPFDDISTHFYFNTVTNTPSNSVDLLNTSDTFIEQDLLRTYLYEVFTDNLVGSLDYRFTRQQINNSDSKDHTNDHTASTALRYFYDNGMFLLGRASYRYQDRLGSEVLADGSSSGWLFDAGVGYRLRNRKGSIALEVKNLLGNSLNLEQLSGIEPFVNSDTTVAVTAKFVF